MSLDAREAAAHFDPTRLKLARQLRAYTRTEVARRAELSPAAVSQYESGANAPRPATIGRLALALSVPVSFLATTGQPTLLPTVDDSFFRSLRRTSKRDRERAAALAGIAAELVRAIERHVELPAFSPFDDLALDVDDPPEAAEEAAVEVRRRWQVPDGPIDNAIRLLERHGIPVLRAELASTNTLDAKNVDAYSWTQGPRPLVILGTEKDVYERSRLDCLHELAHVLLHADPEPANKLLERQAQRFGSAFLAPEELFRELWPTGRLDWNRLQRLRAQLGMSMGALLYRARDLGLMTPTTYTNAQKYMSRRGWRTREPGPRLPPETPGLVPEALRLLTAHGTDLAALADHHHLPHSDQLTQLLGLSGAPLKVSL